jgi:hypothetical protein
VDFLVIAVCFTPPPSREFHRHHQHRAAHLFKGRNKPNYGTLQSAVHFLFTLEMADLALSEDCICEIAGT